MFREYCLRKIKGATGSRSGWSSRNLVSEAHRRRCDNSVIEVVILPLVTPLQCDMVDPLPERQFIPLPTGSGLAMEVTVSKGDKKRGLLHLGFLCPT